MNADRRNNQLRHHCPDMEEALEEGELSSGTVPIEQNEGADLFQIAQAQRA
jgi:hypothetical protein